jgi:hypothetical protein
MEDFGVIVVCCDQDYLFAKGCCASIRHFLGDVPICLLIDGIFSVSSLQKTYDVQVINHLNVKHQVLRERSFGWGLTKMIAFWESPWSNFLVLDADTIVWGNALNFANFRDFDIIVDRPLYKDSFEEFTRFFLNSQEVEKHFPDFRWQAHLGEYFCTGAFFAKRDIFSLDEYINILDFTSNHPNVFKFGEQGFLNFMIFRASDEGRLRLGQERWQVLVPHCEWEYLKKRYPITEAGPILQEEEASVIHWAGPKPILSSSEVYSEPMSFSRRKFLRDARGLTGLVAEVLLTVEDFQRFLKIYKKKFIRKVRKLSGLPVVDFP